METKNTNADFDRMITNASDVAHFKSILGQMNKDHINE